MPLAVHPRAFVMRQTPGPMTTLDDCLCCGRDCLSGHATPAFTSSQVSDPGCRVPILIAGFESYWVFENL
jgi:hypothetical protein